MASNIFDKFTILLNFDTKEFNNSAKKVNDTIEGFVKNSTRSLSGLGKIFGTVLGEEAIRRMVVGFSDMGSRIGYMADNIMDSTRNLQLFEQAAKRTGGSVQGMDTTLSNLSRHLVAIKSGQDFNYNAILGTLGVSALNSDGSAKSPTELLRVIGGALYKKPVNGALGQRFYENALGIDPNQIRFLLGDKNTVNKTLADVGSSGVLSTNQINTAKQANAALSELSQQFTLASNTLSADLIPDLVQVAGLFNQFVPYIKYVAHPINSATKLGHYLGTDKVGNLPIFNQIHDVIAGVYHGILTHGKSLHYNYNPPNGDPTTISGGASLYDKVIGSFTPNYWDSPAILKAQQMRENARNDPNATMTDKYGNTSYGIYQITPATAKSLTGQDFTPAQLKLSYINKQLRNINIDNYAELAKKAGITNPATITAAALAGHNGGMGGFRHYLKTGHSYNGYAEDILHNAGTKYANLNMDSTNNTSGNIYLQGDVHVVANNPEQFGTQLKANPRVYTAASQAGNRKV